VHLKLTYPVDLGLQIYFMPMEP